jgi:hypothetical protein
MLTRESYSSTGETVSDKTAPETVNATENAHAIIDATPKKEKHELGEKEALDSLREMQENVGQMSELAKEEENLVKEFFNSLHLILKPFSKTLEISVLSLPENYIGRVNKAYMYLTGQLVLVYVNGEVEILNLADQENLNILIGITGEIMTKLKLMMDSHRVETEKRVKFLMSVTKELQKVAKIFSEQ